ncbi:uncharacterized protein LOC132637470 [Lycium barbarum]|uniref:uncharacterized protein LOC132637470 n=1 Tax=Lycium barbarum TaxID=112863 RepID=UPI00293F4334|nr:uncharacterized protein LOC132637470 [Lycium barbarum]
MRDAKHAQQPHVMLLTSGFPDFRQGVQIASSLEEDEIITANTKGGRRHVNQMLLVTLLNCVKSGCTFHLFKFFLDQMVWDMMCRESVRICGGRGKYVKIEEIVKVAIAVVNCQCILDQLGINSQIVFQRFHPDYISSLKLVCSIRSEGELLSMSCHLKISLSRCLLSFQTLFVIIFEIYYIL